MSRTIIFATSNAHKVTELTTMIQGRDVKIASLKEVGFSGDIPETGSTFYENAEIKARHIYDKYGQEVISEDSGLVVDALDGAPGIFSARYAGAGKQAHDNNELLLEHMQGVEDRSARFVAVICHIDQAGTASFYEGRVEGSIADTPRGEEGFGYDPIFIPEGYEQSFAELGSAVKSSVSHRALAVKKLVNNL